MNSALLHTARCLALVAVLMICGGHWTAMQAIAWARMLVDYTQRSGVVMAVSETFDGAHPCSMCRAVEKGSSEQKQPDVQASVLKITMLQWQPMRLIFQEPGRIPWRISDWQMSARADEPSVPPPRMILG